jgi:arsenite-transporting ATPase
MHERHAIVAEALGGSVGVSELVQELRNDAEMVDRRLHDTAHTRIFWVALPEPVAIAEALDAIAWLRTGGFPLASIVLNRLTRRPDAAQRGSACGECRARVASERAALAPLALAASRARPATPLRIVPALDAEPRGVRPLRRLAGALDKQTRTLPAPRQSRARGGTTRPPAEPRVLAQAGDTVPISAATRLLFFGGKGGVGKTTCAAAVAVTLAARFPNRAVRLISTDPAPSLGDVFAIGAGDGWTHVPTTGRLEVRELDAASVFDAYRRRYSEAVAGFFDRLRGGSSFDATADRAVFERLFELAPPGIDELIALLAVVDLLQEDREDLLIVDTAPTGHTLRLLAMQGDMRQWVALLMQLLMKYQLAARAEAFVRDLVQLSKNLRAFAALLTDGHRARFATVVRPAALPRLETARLLHALNTLRVAAPILIVNGETAGTCRACARRAKGEREELARLRRLCRGASGPCDIMHAPIQFPPPTGAGELLAWSGRWRRDDRA